MTIASHFLVGDDGALYDTRKSYADPVRRNYSRQRSRILTTADLLATLRAGQYAWPGGYPLYFITEDGAALSFATVRAELANVIDDIRRGCNSGWRVVACDVNWEDASLVDDHTGEGIESAYE